MLKLTKVTTRQLFPALGTQYLSDFWMIKLALVSSDKRISDHARPAPSDPKERCEARAAPKVRSLCERVPRGVKTEMERSEEGVEVTVEGEKETHSRGCQGRIRSEKADIPVIELYGH